VPDAQPACPNCGRPLASGADECPACTSLAATAAATLPAPRLLAGRYLPQRLLGRGGAKEVWLAHDLTLDRPVALSRLRSGAAGEEAREKVAREARLMARLGDHPGIVAVYDAMEDDGALVIIARYMRGGPLAARAAAAPERRLPVADVVRAGIELADALEHAHRQDVVHRDVKPDNAWLGADGSAALGDWGIATAPGIPGEPGVGTPYYAAPEQAAGAEAGPAADLYALGATLYELLSGRPPFVGTTSEEIARQHRSAAPAPLAGIRPDAPVALEQLLSALLAKAPEDRPGSAGEVREQLRAVREGTAPVRVRAKRLAPLIGRAPELRAGVDNLLAARSGGQRLIAIAGEAGIGKTRLALELDAEARAAGMLVVWGRGSEDSGAYALWTAVLREGLAQAGELPPQTLAAVRRLAGDPGATAAEPAAGDRARLFDSAARLLEQAAGPSGLLIVLDDLHWADASSLALLRHISRAAASAKLALALTYREDELHEDHPLTQLLEDLRHARGFVTVGLAGLDVDGVRALVPAGLQLSPAAAETLHERTGGNPFFVAELARTLAGTDPHAAALPRSVRETVLRRVKPLPVPSRRALEGAAVFGRPFTVAVAGRIGGLSRAEAGAALAPARTARLVTELADDPGRLAFSHAIVRDVVRESIAPARRGPLHAAVVALLRGRAHRGADVPLAEVAHHALIAAREGEDPQPAYDLALEAAEEASTVLAHTEAARHYADALEALDELGAEAPAGARTATLEALAAETTAAGDIDAGKRHYRGLAAAGRQAGDAEVIARAALGFAEFTRYGELDTAAIMLLEEALAVLPPDDSSLRSRGLALLGARLSVGPDRSRSEALVDEAAAMARRLGDDQALMFALWITLLPGLRARPPVRAAAADEILALAPRASGRNGLLWAHMSRFVDALEHGDQAGMEIELVACAALERSSRRSYFRWCVTLLRATSAIFTGRLAEGAALAEDAAAQIGGAYEDAEQEVTAQRLTLATLRWRPADADFAALRAYAARYPDLGVWSAMLANLAWQQGRTQQVPDAVAAATRHGLQALIAGRDGLAASALLAEPVVAARDPELSEELLALLTPYRDHNPVMEHGWTAWGPVARPLGVLAAALGRRGEAATLFDRAVALGRHWGAPAWELRAIGDWLDSGADVPDRAGLVARGLRLADELELAWVAGRLAGYVTRP
jgi:hypothetical protein